MLLPEGLVGSVYDIVQQVALGYSFLGRMFAMGQVQGILATVDRELGSLSGSSQSAFSIAAEILSFISQRLLLFRL